MNLGGVAAAADNDDDDDDDDDDVDEFDDGFDDDDDDWDLDNMDNIDVEVQVKHQFSIDCCTHYGMTAFRHHFVLTCARYY